MSRAFLLEPPRAGPRGALDIGGASTYGEVKYLFEPGDHRSGIIDEAFDDDVLNAFEDLDYDPVKDYFVFAGGLVPMVRVATALTRRYGRFRALLFCTSTRKYVEVEMGDTTYAQASDRDLPNRT